MQVFHQHKILLFVVLLSVTRAQQQTDLWDSMLRNIMDAQRSLLEKVEDLTFDMKTMKTNIATLMLNEAETRADVRKMTDAVVLFEDSFTSVKNNMEEIMGDSGIFKGMLNATNEDLISFEVEVKSELLNMRSDISRVIEKEEENKVILEDIRGNITNERHDCHAIMDSINARPTIGNLIRNESDVQEDQPRQQKSHSIQIHQSNKTVEKFPQDCSMILNNDEKNDGIYKIFPSGPKSDGLEVYCDQQTSGGGWTVFLQRRIQEQQVDFAKSFEEYATGFGNSRGEFWIGNRALHLLTRDRPHILRVEAKNLKGEMRYGTWATFNVGSEEALFTLSVENYVTNSTLGNGLNNADGKSWQSNKMNFTTVDKNNGKRCARVAGKGGWWYDSCYGANPTARIDTVDDDDETMNWYYWETNGTTGYTGLNWLQFKIRPQ